MSLTEKVKTAIHNCYYIIVNTLIAITVVVVCCHLILKWISSETDHNYARKLSKEERAAYGHMSDQEINDLLNSTWSPRIGGWQYDEWVGFKEAPRKTKYVNVNEHGLRQNSSRPISMEELNGSIWFFGGSTTFGYGVADHETIPAKLENLTKTRVYNFGRGYFYSAQENQLFRQYLKAGYRPKLAIFLDGINERCSIGVYQGSMGAIFDKTSRYLWSLTDAVYPVILLTEKLKAKFGPEFSPVDTEAIHDTTCTSCGTEQPLPIVLQQNLLERHSVCTQYSVNCITFVQPFAGVHGIHSDKEALSENDRKTMSKTYMLLESTWAETGAVFVTSAFDNLKKHAYVDNYHYSAEASELIAKEIAKKLKY